MIINDFVCESGDGATDDDIEWKWRGIFIEDEDSEDLIKISFRSKNDFPCNLFASEFFDGGGHKNAAGGKFSGKLDEATSKFKDSIKKFNSKNKLWIQKNIF